MKKTLVSLAVLMSLILFSTSGFSQVFKEGTNVINAGIGFGSHYYSGFGSGFSSTPALTLTFDHGFKQIDDIKGTIGLGGIIGFQGSTYEWNDGLGDSYKEHWSNVIIAPRATYHADFITSDNWDLFASIFLGIRIENYSFESNNPNYSALYEGNYGGVNFAAGLTVGAAYYFTPVVGAFAELGYDVAFFKVGISIKTGGE
jgi:hypothetical protein